MPEDILMHQKKRLVGLDLMRTIAILLVVYQHGQFFFYPFSNPAFGNLSFAMFGYFGVEMFFVLSGFLIGNIFLAAYEEKKRFDLKDLLLFWKRRWLRTLPN